MCDIMASFNCRLKPLFRLAGGGIGVNREVFGVIIADRSLSAFAWLWGIIVKLLCYSGSYAIALRDSAGRWATRPSD